jgi:hypothetical protein
VFLGNCGRRPVPVHRNLPLSRGVPKPAILDEPINAGERNGRHHQFLVRCPRLKVKRVFGAKDINDRKPSATRGL